MFGSFTCDDPSYSKHDVGKKGRPSMIVVYPNNDPTCKHFRVQDEALYMSFFGD